MNNLSTKLIAGATLVSLGGLAGFALKDNQTTASNAAADKRPAVHVRTQVIRRTIRIHRKPKPYKPPVAASAGAPAPTQVVAAAPPVPVATPVAPVRTNAPLRTRTSGAAGGRGEHESEHEGHDD